MTDAMPQALQLDRLRAILARLERPSLAAGAGVIPLCDELPLPEGGLPRAALHEILAAEPGAGAGFAAMLLGRAGGAVLWITLADDELLPWPLGLARHGLDPARLVVARAGRWADALWAMEEALRCPGLAGVLLVTGWERENRLDMTATRRLQLAAEAGGALGLLLRPDGEGGGASAAVSRWRLTALPDGLAAPHWQLELLRVRGGAPAGPWAVAWHEESGALVAEAMPPGLRAGSIPAARRAEAPSSTPRGDVMAPASRVEPISSAPRIGHLAPTPQVGLTLSAPRAGLTSSAPRTGLTSSAPRSGLTLSAPQAGAASPLPRVGPP